MRLRGALAIGMLVAFAAACSDSVGPRDSGLIPLQLSVAGPQLVSQAELDALGAAFDRVDRYVVEVADSATGAPIVVGSKSVKSVQSS